MRLLLVKLNVILVLFFLIVFVNVAKANAELTFEQDIQNIENYLNAVKTLKATFNQVSSDGTLSSGNFYLSRPGKLRWEYKPPISYTIVVNSGLLTYYDSELDQTSHIPVDKSLGAFLTKPHVSFTDGVKIVNYNKLDNRIKLTIVLKGEESEGKLTMTFRADRIELMEMDVVDAVGASSHVTFSNLVYNLPIENKTFTIPKFKDKK